MQLAWSYLIGGLAGYFVRRRVKASSLPSVMLLAIDNSSLYLFAPKLFGEAQELGRWRLGTYLAAAGNSGRVVQPLTLGVDGLGEVEVEVPIALANRVNAQVIEFVVGHARPGRPDGGVNAPGF